MSDSDQGKADEVRGYVIGYIAAIALTVGAFAIVHWNAGGTATFSIILALALVQAVVHFRFFLHIHVDRSSRDDLQLILFSTLIVLLMVAGTLVILLNLRQRMM